MKLFTRCLFLLTVLALPLASTLAANITIVVGDNYYRGPGNTTGTSDIRTITVGDVVTLSYPTGNSGHPTASVNGAWATFR